MSTPHIAVSTEYLRSLTFAFPTDGRAMRTTLPLDPARQYHIAITSQYNLRTLLDGFCRTQSYTTGRWIFTAEHQETICEPPIFFNGKRLPSKSSKSRMDGSYYYNETNYNYHVPKLHFYFWGTGYPLTFQTGIDVSRSIKEATIDIQDLTFEQEQQRQEEEQRRLQTLREQELQRQRALVERERLRQQELAHAQRLLAISQEQERIKQETQQVYLKVFLGAAALLLIMFLWWCAATRARRRAVRFEELQERRLAEEQRTKDLLRQLLEEEDPAQARALFDDLLKG
jgi:hypothetical protein